MSHDPAPNQVRTATVAEEVNEAMGAMLPWLASLLFHAAVVLLAVFAAWSYVTVEPPAVATPYVSFNPHVAQPLNALEPTDMSAKWGQTRTVESAAPDLPTTPEIEQPTDLAIVDLPTPTDLKIDGHRPVDVVQGPFGPRISTTARRIVYVIDASGSLVDTLPFVIKELKGAIRQLGPMHQFTIIFFQGGDAIEVPPVGWKAATEEMRKEVQDWITLENGNIVPRGSSSPVKALQLAMRYRPELVFILSDNITGRGRHQIDREELLKMLRETNPVVDPATGRRVAAINTIQFLYPDPLGTLEQIAREHGGRYAYIRESDLGIRD